MAARPPLDGGTILITGASAGLGKEMARQLAPRARALVLVARRRESLESLREALLAAHPSLQVVVEPCDLSDVDALDPLLERVAAQVGEIDVLINNAGFGDIELFEESDEHKLRQMIALNTLTPVVLTRRLLPAMLARRRGGILNVSSAFGLTFMPVTATYIGTKHFLTSFTESLRIELFGTGVAVSQTCPGPISTEFEANAGNPVGMGVPWPLELSAERAVRVMLRGFDRGRAMIVPGFWISLAIWAGRIAPRWVLRLIYAPLAGLLRRKRARAAAAAQRPSEA